MNFPNVKTIHTDYPAALPTFGVLGALTLGLMLFSGGETTQPKPAATENGSTATQQVATTATSTTSTDAAAAKPDPEKSKGATTSTAPAKVAAAAPDRAAIEGIVRSFLMENPEILLEVQQALEVKMTAEREERAKVAVTENAAKIFRAAGDPIYGNPDGDVTVVEFFDYNCGFCKRAIPHLTQLVEADKNVKIVFKEFPIFGEESEQAALAALASRKQGKYWEMHRALLERPGRANKQKALDIARSLNMDVTKLEADMELPEIRQVITDAQSLAQAMGIQGTPHFLVGPQTIPGAPEDLLQQILTRVADVRKVGCTVC